MTATFTGDTSAQFTLGGIPSTRLAAPGELKLPLVSFIVRNWNYAGFIDATLQSIQGQDYPRFEAIVVDNASTDSSRDVIRKTVGDDPRFTVIHSQTNLGPLGGALRGLEAARGEFVVFVDSDDTLLSNFASMHVQVHLAGRLNIAFTSCCALETTRDGVMVNGHRERTMLARPEAQQDLRPAAFVPRLATIDDATYAQLARGTTILDPRISIWHWPWSPGTSNMYRRFMVDLVAPVCDDPDRLRRLAADGHYNRLCHLLGGSAIIDVPLSTYRVHDQNFYASAPSLRYMGTNGGPASNFGGLRIRELIRVLVTHAEDFSWRIGADRYWNALGMLLQYPRHTSDPDDGTKATAFLAEQLPRLNAVFGEKQTLRQLAKRTSPRLLGAALRQCHGSNMPFGTRRELPFLGLRRLKGRIREKLRKWRGRGGNATHS
ncbi:glycosyltransferase family 2 protein [Kaistia granuli]|uniref:glycosyltransferase family 2 protein n=1 Tax=Kaistia granuli TaxID=363259 RepID=UPI0003AB0F28|nr:glycosyltransferase family A protein [Kaistia granuli]